MIILKAIRKELVKISITFIFLITLYYPTLYIHSLLDIYTIFSTKESARNNTFIYYLSFCLFLITTITVIKIRKILITHFNSKAKQLNILNNTPWLNKIIV